MAVDPSTYLPGAAQALSPACSSIITALSADADRIGQLLLNEGTAVAKAIIRPILTAEIIFSGFRILFKSNVIEQLSDLTIKMAIIFFLVYSPGAQVFLSKTLSNNLVAGAQTVADQCLPSAYAGSKEPVDYWLKWMGTPGSNNGALNYSTLVQRIWSADQTERNVVQQLTPKTGSTMSLGQLATQDPPKKNSETKTGDAPLTKDLMMEALIIFQPFQALSSMLQLATVTVGCMLLPLFTTLGVLAASRYAFAIVLGLGVAVLPAFLFKSFKYVWIHYLTILTGLMLVPPLFYILSAIGFSFSTLAFDQIFPVGGYTAIPNLLRGSFEQAISVIFSSDQTGFMSLLGNVSAKAIKAFAYLAILSKMIFGVMIVGVFVGAGTGFGALAIPLAMKWNHAFSAETILESIQRVFTGLQGAIGSGMSMVYGSGLQAASGMMGGAMRGGSAVLGGKVKA